VLTKKQERLALVARQVDRLDRRLTMLDALNARCWRYKLMDIFICFICTTIAMRIALLAGGLCIIAGVAVFLFLQRDHNRVRSSFLSHKYLLQVYEIQLARLKLDWEKLPFTSTSPEPADHPFEVDLDITGEHSLLRLMNTGVSLEGEQRLREWLLTQVPNLDVIRERQVLVNELAPLRLFRDKFMLNSLFATRTSSSLVAGEKLLLWLKAKGPTNTSMSSLVVPSVLSLFVLISLALFLIMHITPLIFVLALLFSVGWYLYTQKDRGTLYADVAYVRSMFDQLQMIFEYLEKYPYSKQVHLKRLCEPFFKDAEHRPSILLKQLARVSNIAVFENANIIGLLVNAIIPVDSYASYFLSKYRARIAEQLPGWLETWYELEALSSLANFAYLNPDYSMPEFLLEKQTQEQHVVFRAREIGHPLLPAEKKVVNDYTMEQQGTVMLITGSNMAGKSTFLRTLGLNLCLAYAGAPVNARSLETVLFELYGCIKVSDSVTDGYSYFYAEVRRLRGLLRRLEAGSRYPIFFMIDEIFKGTNNRERLIGSTAYIHALAGKNCVGAISTHDLELVKLAETLPRIRNYHFREDVVNGRMSFAYKLRHGPCPTTNALKIMELEGLPTSY
jgi:ABC-type multidrug transport system fused ATPase/permease subunit